MNIANTHKKKRWSSMNSKQDAKVRGESRRREAKNCWRDRPQSQWRLCRLPGQAFTGVREKSSMLPCAIDGR